jgi:hypothetical protein
MARNKKAEIKKNISRQPIVRPGKRPSHLKAKEGETVQWENKLPATVLLIFEEWVNGVFTVPPPLVLPVPPSSSTVRFAVKPSVPPGNRGPFAYKAYVVETNEYAQGGSDPEMEVK